MNMNFNTVDNVGHKDKNNNSKNNFHKAKMQNYNRV